MTEKPVHDGAGLRVRPVTTSDPDPSPPAPTEADEQPAAVQPPAVPHWENESLRVPGRKKLSGGVLLWFAGSVFVGGALTIAVYGLSRSLLWTLVASVCASVAAFALTLRKS